MIYGENKEKFLKALIDTGLPLPNMCCFMDGSNLTIDKVTKVAIWSGPDTPDDEDTIAGVLRAAGFEVRRPA